jgi:hypothetical protein
VRLCQPPTNNVNTTLLNRRFRFRKRSQLFIGTHNETLSVVATCGSDKTVCPVLGGLFAVPKGSEYSLFECPICLTSSISLETLLEEIRLTHPAEFR